jgi:hypothetical protein
MTKNDLFKIILKLFGLLSVIGIFLQIPTLIFYYNYESNLETSTKTFWFLLLILGFIILITYILFFKADLIINLFRLDKGFDNDEISLITFSSKNVIKLALITISIYLIMNNIVEFLSQIVFAFKASIARNNLEAIVTSINPISVDYWKLTFAGVNILVGFLILTSNTRIANWIEKLEGNYKK